MIRIILVLLLYCFTYCYDQALLELHVYNFKSTNYVVIHIMISVMSDLRILRIKLNCSGLAVCYSLTSMCIYLYTEKPKLLTLINTVLLMPFFLLSM